VAAVDTLSGPLVPIAVETGRARHSASEVLAFNRCQRKHWFAFVIGVREPEMDRTTAEFIDAVTRGKIVHDVLEHLRVRDELDGVLEDAIRRCDPDAPAPEQPGGKRYRRLLRTEVTRVADHPDYRAIVDLRSARRELRFVHIERPRVVYEGGIDLAAREDHDLVLLDVKTSKAGREDLQRKAEQYRPQRDVYIAAAEAISGLDVGRFAFQFSQAGLQISDAIADDERRALPQQLRRAAEEMERGPPRMTDFPAECGFCGYRRVGWCAGVKEEEPRGRSRSTQDFQQLSLDLG
jgi:CRISPR/Cas system-associated exonuclease Cas4 (RecB family)